MSWAPIVSILMFLESVMAMSASIHSKEAKAYHQKIHYGQKIIHNEY